jgi:hypothetical protein
MDRARVRGQTLSCLYEPLMPTPCTPRQIAGNQGEQDREKLDKGRENRQFVTSSHLNTRLWSDAPITRYSTLYRHYVAPQHKHPRAQRVHRLHHPSICYSLPYMGRRGDFLSRDAERPRSGPSQGRICKSCQLLWACCIDKRNSSDMSEAINSMFRYYRDAGECLIYLSDVPAVAEDTISRPQQLSYLRASLWFTQGWDAEEETSMIL